MKKGFIGFVFFFVLMPGAFAQPSEYKLAHPPCCLEFHIRSTLHNIDGKAALFSAEAVRFDFESAMLQSPITLTVKIGAFSTKNAKRDEAMFAMFGDAKYPYLNWEGRDLTCEREDKDHQKCNAAGVLTIRDRSQSVDLELHLLRMDGGIQVTGNGIVRLKDFGLKPPSVLGIIRVDDEIKITFDTLWEQKPN